jgi:hypothetical protein
MVEIKYELELYTYLDELQRSGITSMFGARPYLMVAFDMDDKKEAGLILNDWMETFSARREAGETGD